MQKKIPLHFFLILVLLALHSQVYAASCTGVSATALTFSPMVSGGGIQALPVTLTYTCTGAVTISISSGTPYSSGDRQLFAGGDGGIPYTVKDSDTNLWGDGVNTAALGKVFSTTGTGIPASVTATFSVTVPSDIASGIYTNSLDIKIFDGATLLASTTLIPTLIIVDSCTISSAPTVINFGAVPAGASSVAAQTATIGITCGNGLPYLWGADKGSGNNWNGVSRRMKASGSSTYIAYTLEEGGSPLGDLNLPPPYAPTTAIPGRADTANGTQKIYTVTATITENPIPSAADIYTDTVSYYVVW